MMSWGEFRELFMGKFFPASARHAKAQEFLKLKQGNMTMLEYVTKFTELACFRDDYVAIDLVKVWKFEDRLKLSIRGKIVGFLLQDMDSMVRTTMTIKREIEDVRSIRAVGTSEKRENQPSSSLGKRHKTFAPRVFQGRGRVYQGQGQTKVSTQLGPLTCFHFHQP